MQEEQGILLPLVMRDAAEGAEVFYNVLDTIDWKAINGRYEQTTHVPTSSYKVWGRTYKFDAAVIRDEWDEKDLADIISPDSDIVRAQVAGFNRLFDEKIRDAMVANRRLGENGDTTETFPTGNTIDADFGGSDSGLTLAKIAETARLFDEMRAPRKGRVFVYSASQLSDLVTSVAEVKSLDYIRQSVLENRTLPDGWMGFERFVQYDDLVADATDTDARVCLAFVRDHMIAFDGEYRFSTDILATQNHAIQLRPRARIGAMRKQNSVIRILCQDDNV
jgi:hypothetical protein